LTFYAFLSVFA